MDVNHPKSGLPHLPHMPTLSLSSGADSGGVPLLFQFWTCRRCVSSSYVPYAVYNTEGNHGGT